MSSYVITAISNAGGAPEQAYRKMQSAGACAERPYAEMYKFEVPSLMVGTLDTLMNLSDDLGKSDAVIDGIVRKIEKCSADLYASSVSSSSSLSTGGRHNSSASSRSGGSSGGGMDLTIGGIPPTRYVAQFAWDSAKYPHRRPLKELVSLIAGGAAAVDEELKQLQNSFADKTLALQEAKRKQGGNLLVADLNDVLTDAMMSKIKRIDSEYLTTVFVAVPGHMTENFEGTIYKVGSDLVGYGGPDWNKYPTRLGEPVWYGPNVDRHKVRGSPVVPNSLQKVHSDADSALYAVTILKGQFEAGYFENNEFQQGTSIDFVSEFTKLCKEKRFVVRSDFVWDPHQASKSAIALEKLQVEVDSMQSALMRWCKNHFGDVFVAYMHMKVVRVFVESVLRYGLPVDFTTVLFKVHPHKEHLLIESLDKHLSHSASHQQQLQASSAEDQKADDGDEEYHDFVMLKFEL